MVKVTDNFNFLFDNNQNEKLDNNQNEKLDNLKKMISEFENKIKNNDLEYPYNVNIYKELYYPFANYLLNEGYIKSNELQINWEVKDLLFFMKEIYNKQFDQQINHILRMIQMKRNNDSHNYYPKSLTDIISSLKYFWYVLYFFKFNKYPTEPFNELIYYRNSKPVDNKVLENDESPENNIISTKEIEIHKNKLLNWLTQEKIINIPMYQRSYRWNNINCKSLYDDIKLRSEDGESHYFGVVAAKIKNNKIKIIDGQQRLITSILFCCAIREIMKQIDNDVYKKSKIYSILNKEKSLDTYFENPTGINSLNESLKHILNGNLEKLEPYKKTSVYCNFQSFMNWIYEDLKNKIKIGEKLEFLNSISTSFLEQFVLATLSFDQLTNPKKELIIFENINSKGKSLDFIDFCKNYLFIICKDEELHENNELNLIKYYNSIFSPEETQEEKEEFFEILINYYTGEEVPKVIGSKLNMFKGTISLILKDLNIIEEDKLDLNNFKHLVKKLKEFHDYYYCLLRNKYNEIYTNNRLSVLLKVIKTKVDRLKFATILFFIYEYTLKNNLVDNKGNINNKSKKNIQELLFFCFKSYLKVKIASKLGDSNLKRFFIKLSNYLKENFLNNETILLNSNEINSFLQSLPKKEEIETSLIQVMTKNDVVKLLLFLIENNLTKGFFDGELIELESKELEHFLPTTLKSYHISASYYEQHKDSNKEEIQEKFMKDSKEFVNKIGNLLLVPKYLNSQMSNKDCQDKIKLMEENNVSSPLFYNESIGLKNLFTVNETWDFDSINNRTKKIANYCMLKIFND